MSYIPGVSGPSNDRKNDLRNEHLARPYAVITRTGNGYLDKGKFPMVSLWHSGGPNALLEVIFGVVVGTPLDMLTPLLSEIWRLFFC